MVTCDAGERWKWSLDLGTNTASPYPLIESEKGTCNELKRGGNLMFVCEIVHVDSTTDARSMMGGKGSGVTSKRQHYLPRKYSEGALARLDRRYRDARHMLAAIEQMKADQGDAPLSFVKLRLIQRTAHLDALLITEEARLAKGENVDLARYLATLQTFVRLASTLGLERRARKVVTLRDYVAARSVVPASTPEAEAPE